MTDTTTETPTRNPYETWFKITLFGVCALIVMMGISFYVGNAYREQSKADAKIYVECLARGGTHSECNNR
jgi:hypothetical protein